MQKITPFLWFDGKAEEAMNFYVSVLGRLMSSGDPEKSNRVMQALWQMEKIEIGKLEEAYEGGMI